MKRSLIMVSVTVMLATTSPGRAASSVDVMLGSLSPDGNVTWGSYLSGAWAVAGNDSLSQEAYDFLPQPDILAEAAVSGAEATARTQEALVRAQASATTGPGSSAGYAYADQQIWFLAPDGGALQFGAEYSITQLLSSEITETAFADASVGFSLYREGGFEGRDDDTLVDESTFYTWNFVENGEFLSDYVADVVSVGGSFGPQEIGYLWLRVDGQATAAVIPAPGAMLLGVLGTGLVGFLRRRVF